MIRSMVRDFSTIIGRNALEMEAAVAVSQLLERDTTLSQEIVSAWDEITIIFNPRLIDWNVWLVC